MKNIIHIDPGSSKPKYRQIIDSVCSAIEKGTLKKGDKIPSLNKAGGRFNLSRDTVMAAFNELKRKGVIYSQPGKGYYIASTEIRQKEKIFVLFDELNDLKIDLYNSLIKSLKGRASVDVFFHHFNFRLFKNLIQSSPGHYTAYIIMPAAFNNTQFLLSKLPPGKVFILDHLKPELSTYPGVYQHFELDFYDALNTGLPLLRKYRKLIFVHPGEKEPGGRIEGFHQFCREQNFEWQVIPSLDGITPRLYEAWFLISDRDLVKLVKLAKNYNYKLGAKFGIVSFNDTMLKEVVAEGITTISTDFSTMGKTLGNMILKREHRKIRNPSRLILRNSL